MPIFVSNSFRFVSHRVWPLASFLISYHLLFLFLCSIGSVAHNVSVNFHMNGVWNFLENCLCQCFFSTWQKCPFEKSENQFFCPKKINFDFNGQYLWTKTGFVAL